MKPVHFAAVGDICLSNTCGKQIELKGFDWPFEKVLPILNQADLLFGNMESVILPPEYPDNFIDPRGLVSKFNGTEVLKRAGFSFINMASNHILDGGEVGLFHTREAIEYHGILTAGVGSDQNQARAMRILEAGGMRFGFLCYCMDNIYALHTSGPCHAYYDPDIVLADIAMHRNDVDVLVVSVHADQENVDTPSPQRRKDFHEFAESGATLVLGHHPHVPQGIELINNHLIAYSLGNFYFCPHTMPWHKRKRIHTSETFVLLAEILPGRVESFQRIPVKIPTPPEMRPIPCNGKEAERMMEYFSLLDQWCSDEEVILRNWRNKALHNFEEIILNVFEDRRALSGGWRYKFLQMVEKSLGISDETRIDLDRVFALIKLLRTPENSEWITEIINEAERRWEVLSHRADPYHRPSYRFSNRNLEADGEGNVNKS